MLKSSEIRAKARKALGGNIFATAWLMALVASLVIVVSGFVGAIPVIGLLASLVITGPVYVGVQSYYLKLVRGEDAKLEDTLSGFKNDFGGNFLLGLMQTLFVFLWSLLFVIPGIIKTYAYSMAFYIKNDHPEYSWKQCLDESQEMMRGNKWRLFCLQLSFIGWMIVGSFCFGIGSLWVDPYMQSATAVFYNELKNN